MKSMPVEIKSVSGANEFSPDFLFYTFETCLKWLSWMISELCNLDFIFKSFWEFERKHVLVIFDVNFFVEQLFEDEL